MKLTLTLTLTLSLAVLAALAVAAVEPQGTPTAVSLKGYWNLQCRTEDETGSADTVFPATCGQIAGTGRYGYASCDERYAYVTDCHTAEDCDSDFLCQTERYPRQTCFAQPNYYPNIASCGPEAPAFAPTGAKRVGTVIRYAQDTNCTEETAETAAVLFNECTPSLNEGNWNYATCDKKTGEMKYTLCTDKDCEDCNERSEQSDVCTTDLLMYTCDGYVKPDEPAPKPKGGEGNKIGSLKVFGKEKCAKESTLGLFDIYDKCHYYEYGLGFSYGYGQCTDGKLGFSACQDVDCKDCQSYTYEPDTCQKEEYGVGLVVTLFSQGTCAGASKEKDNTFVYIAIGSAAGILLIGAIAGIIFYRSRNQAPKGYSAAVL